MPKSLALVSALEQLLPIRLILPRHTRTRMYMCAEVLAKQLELLRIPAIREQYKRGKRSWRVLNGPHAV